MSRQLTQKRSFGPVLSGGKQLNIRSEQSRSEQRCRPVAEGDVTVPDVGKEGGDGAIPPR